MSAFKRKLNGAAPASKAWYVDEAYRCHRDPQRAHEVAETLVNEWATANTLAAAHGDEFVAILQPVAFIGSPAVDHLPNLDARRPGLRDQYAAVYPEILKIVSKHPELKFLDLTHSYDGHEHYYIDFCHVSPQGHERLVEDIVAGLEQLGVIGRS